MSLSMALSAVPILILLNAFFVSAEYAVVSIRPAQVAALRNSGRLRTANAIERLKADPASAIGAIQVCITMTNLMLGWIGEPAMSALLVKAMGPLAGYLHPAVFQTISVGLSFIIVTLLTVVLSELLPKALTLRYGMVAATLTAQPILWVQWLVRPLVWLMTHMANAVTTALGLGRVDELDDEPVTVDELRLLAQRAGESGALGSQEQKLVLNSLALNQRKARDVMVHRSNVAHLDLQKSMDDNRRVMNAHLFSRLPLVNGGFDHIVGIVPTREFLSAYHAEGDSSVLQLIARKPIFVPEQATVDKLLNEFSAQRTQMMFVVNEYGGVEGIVTLTDVVDTLLHQTIGEEA